MTWIDWVTVACVVCAALLSILEWQVFRYEKRLRAKLDRAVRLRSALDLLKPDLAAPAAYPGVRRRR
jgi:hypothetical protein